MQSPTFASLEERKEALEALARRAPRAAWRICLDQVDPGSTIGHENHRPRWRSDASGAGQADTGREAQGFVRAALDLALARPDHDATMLSDLVGVVHRFQPEDQEKVWDPVDARAEKEQDDTARAVVREHIRRFAFTRRSKYLRINSRAKERARHAHASLTPRDVVIPHQWLFAARWLQGPVGEMEDDPLDDRQREEPGTIGWRLADGVINEAGFAGFLTRCLAVNDPTLAAKIDELPGGFLRKLSRDSRQAAARARVGSLIPDQMARLP